MTPEDARTWLDTIAAVAVVVWAVGVWFVLRTGRLCAEPVRETVDAPGSLADVLTRVARAVADSPIGSPLQRATVESATQREVRWTSRGAFAHEGLVRPEHGGGKTKVAFEVVVRSPMLVVGKVVCVVGAVVIGVLWWMLGERVVPDPNEAVRAQVVQMVQAVHVLWPPFLFAGLPRVFRVRIVDEVRRILRTPRLG